MHHAEHLERDHQSISDPRGALVVPAQTVRGDVPAWAKRLPGYYGWVILTVSWLCIFASAPGQTYTISVFVDPMIHETGWSRTLVAGLYTAGSLVAATGLLLIGRLFDRCGARGTLTLVVLALGGAIWWMSGVTEPFHLFMGFMALRTLGQGSLPHVATTMVATWFVRRGGTVSALTAIASPASQATFPVLAYVLITHFGCRTAWTFFAWMVWGPLLLPALLLVRQNPEAVGLQPDGDTVPGLTRPPLPGMSVYARRGGGWAKRAGRGRSGCSWAVLPRFPWSARP